MLSEYYTPPSAQSRPPFYDEIAAPIYAGIFQECQDRLSTFSPDAPRPSDMSLSQAIEQIIKPALISVAPLHRYIEHIANNKRLGNLIAAARNTDLVLPRTIDEISFAAKFLQNFEGQRPERSVGTYALTEREYGLVKEKLGQSPILARTLSVVQSIVSEHYQNLDYYFYAHQNEMPRYKIDQKALTDKIMAASNVTVLHELLPALTHADLGEALNKSTNTLQTEQAFKHGLMEAFRLNAFNIIEDDEKKKCPFSSNIVQLWSSVVKEDENGHYSISSQMRPGAFPAFIARKITAHSAPCVAAPEFVGPQ